MDKDTKLKSAKNVISLVLTICFVSILLITISSCKISIVRGSGNVISEDRAVSTLSKVSVSGSGNLFIEQGDEESLTIEAEDNILPLIITKVSGSTLTIGFKLGTNVSTTKSIEFHLKVKDLESISTTGSGNVNCSGLITDRLTIKTTGSGNVDMSNLKTDSIDIDSTGSGDFILAGNTDNLEITATGSGNYNAGDLESKQCKIEATGSGDLTVNVNDVLDVFIGGSGNVSYMGNPSVDYSERLGISGEIINISE